MLVTGFASLPAQAAIADKVHLALNIAPHLLSPKEGIDILPNVDRSLAGRFDGAPLRDRLHHFDLVGGAHRLTFDAGRGWGRIDGAAGMRSVGQPASFGAASLGYSLDIGNIDSIRLTATATSERHNPGLAATEYRSSKSTNSSLTLGWQHGQRWRLEGGLVAVRSSSHAPADGPAVGLLGGTTPAEHGPQVIASYAADERSPWRALRLGMSVGDMALDGPSASALAPAQRRDIRAVFNVGFRFR